MTNSICINNNLNGEAKAVQPLYGKGEEIFNAVSHIVGGGLGIIFGVIAFIIASFNPTANKFAAVGVYTFSLIMLYTMSALYHFLPQGRAKKVFRVFDHCTIFLLIAGCYTPFCLLPLWGTAMGIVILAVEWGLAVLGITFNAINMHWKAVKILSQISYVVMGWLIIPAIPMLLNTVSLSCFLWLLAGGIAYTAGIIFFALGKKKKYMHCVWHLFVLVGTVFQFISIVGLL